MFAISLSSRLVVASLAFFLLACLSAADSAAADLSGPWVGSWQSDSSGHRGPLRANFVRVNDSQYQVTFRGRFLKVIPFRYSLTLNVIQEGDVTVLQGSHYLGRMFGTFTYYAEATSCRFHASYNSCKDRGQFNLSR